MEQKKKTNKLKLLAGYYKPYKGLFWQIYFLPFLEPQ